MTPALLDAPSLLPSERPAGDQPTGGPRVAPRAGGRPLTLEQRLQAVLSGAQRDGSAECPVCHAAMRAEAAAARCGGCGSVLS